MYKYDVWVIIYFEEAIKNMLEIFSNQKNGEIISGIFFVIFKLMLILDKLVYS